MTEPKIIFEDNQILVIDKPWGLTVNRAETVHEPTLQDWLDNKIKNDNQEETEYTHRSGLVHRLDKDTSGVMVTAKTVYAYKNLIDQFKNRQVQKKYLALVHGIMEPKKGSINLPLGRHPKDRKKFGIVIGGRQALTYYARLKIFRSPLKELFSLLELEPKTGRTHQIRVHLAHLHHPLASDPVYLGHKLLLKDRRWCWRLFLHSTSLQFVHPETKKQVVFVSELPRQLKNILRKLS